MVIYGLGGSAQDAMRFSRYGVNAVFQEPLDRPAALKLVRATQMLVLHEFRRYVRIPIITEISIVTDGQPAFYRYQPGNQYRWMSVKSPEDVAPGTGLEVSFALLTSAADLGPRECQLAKAEQDLWSSVRRQGRTPIRIKEWIEAYLEN